jgi:hypothetical protein
VLSAIRITTKQKKLQITIPKLDHFVHRTLRETGRLLWNNAFLFADIMSFSASILDFPYALTGHIFVLSILGFRKIDL